MIQRVCLMGASLATGNMGVTALGSSLVKLICDVAPEVEISAFLPERSDRPQVARVHGCEVKVGVINYRLSPRGGLRNHLGVMFLGALLYRLLPFRPLRQSVLRWNPKLATLSRQDLVGNIWGGDSFSDLYGLRRVFEGAIASLTVILLGRPFCLLPQTYGPYRSRLARALAQAVIRRATPVLCRDPEGPRAVRALLGSCDAFQNIRFCPDVAFALEAEAADTAVIEPPYGPSGERPLVGFNVSGLLYKGGYSRDNMFGLSMNYREFTHQAAKIILSETECDLLLIPHTFAPEDDVESDPFACRQVAESLVDFSNRVYRLTGPPSPQILKGVIARCSFFAGSRMHACIAALSQGVPTVGIAYSDKFQGVFASVGEGCMVIDARCETLDSALERLMAFYRRAEWLKARVAERAERLRKLLAGEFERLLKDSLA